MIRLVEKYLMEQGKATVPQAQHKFSTTYSQARQAFKQLEEAGKIKKIDSLTYEWCQRVVQPQPQPQPQPQGNPTPGILHWEVRTTEPSEDAAAKERQELIKKRREEMMELIAKSSQQDDEDDEVDDDEIDSILEDILHDDDDDSYDYGIFELDSDNKPPRPSLIEGFDYGDKMEIARKVAHKMAVFGMDVKIKAIQIGTKATRYIFEYVSSKVRISDFYRYETDIKACIATDNNVKLIAPYNNDQVAIDVEHDYELDAFCKQALLYWWERQSGIASIASLQRGLGIGFNRAGRVMDTLQKLNCVETLSPDSSSIKPMRVKLSKDDIHTLFPKSLGWQS